jgi:hypothetical protein
MSDISPREIIGPTDLDEAAITKEFQGRRPTYISLAEEVKFVLESIISRNNIKIHGIETRVKEIESVLAKCRRKQIGEPFEQVTDLVGCRVICLFRSDIGKLGALLEEEFSVKSMGINPLDDRMSWTYIPGQGETADAPPQEPKPSSTPLGSRIF